MKILFSTLILVFSSMLCVAQQPTPSPTPDTTFTRPYYMQRATQHKQLPKIKNAIVFLGDSITDGNEWIEQLGCARCQNRGISGDISAGVLARLDDILAEKPAKIFLMIGVNDLSRSISAADIITSYRTLVERTKTSSPKTHIYLQSVLPVNSTFRKFADKIDEDVKVLNAAMKEIADKDDAVTYVDLHTPFSDGEGRLDKRYTNDGLHLLGDGYVLWAKVLREQGHLK